MMLLLSFSQTTLILPHIQNTIISLKLDWRKFITHAYKNIILCLNNQDRLEVV